MSDEGDCRTTPATPGLLNIYMFLLPSCVLALQMKGYCIGGEIQVLVQVQVL